MLLCGKMLYSLSLIVAVVLLTRNPTLAQYPLVSIRQIQEVPVDSLLLLDSCSTCPWTLQASPYRDDTVTVIALCVMPAVRVSGRYVMLLYDTSGTERWRGLYVRSTTDTMRHIQDGIVNVATGDIIRMTGSVIEFPNGDRNSRTEFQPIPGIPISILSRRPTPNPTRISVCELNEGIGPLIRFRHSRGEPLESMIVRMDSVTVVSYLGTCDYTLISRAGCEISTFTIGSRCERPPLNALIDVRGMVVPPITGSEVRRGFRIGFQSFSFTTDVNNLSTLPPTSFALQQNYPNPFNPTTEIRYQTSEVSRVTLKVFDMLGREVATLVDEVQDAGLKLVEFDATGLASGVYFYRLAAGGFVETKKLILVR